MKLNSKQNFSKSVFSGILILALFSLPFEGQTKKTTPKKDPVKTTDRDLKPRTTSTPSTTVSSTVNGPTFDKNKRLALVIGNSDYVSKPLSNPVNDAGLLGQTLENVGFRVIVKQNLKLSEMKSAIQEFSRQLPPGGVGLFYFAGHGIQINGRNFLIPTDFDTAQPDVAKQAVEVDSVIKEISGRTGLNILILDACRNAPQGFKASGDKGLAEIKNAPTGTYIAFSTAPGKTAKDGTGNYSPYAESLAANLRLNPSRLEDVFIRTRIQMDNKTGGEQTPWENSSIRNIFYFREDSLPQMTSAIMPEIGGLQIINNLSVVVPVLDETGEEISRLRKTVSYFMESAAGLKMMQIRGGRFLMGTSWDEVESAYNDAQKYKETISQKSIAAEMPQHQVNVPGFYISQTEITQGQWRAVMGELPDIPAEFRGDDLPVVNVTWRQAQQFCQKLSTPERKYRLPTEAEWEYAAKAETNTPFPFGKTINSALANFNGRAPFLSAIASDFRQRLIPVGSLKVLNGFGLADMSGNVWEWTADNWHDNYNEAPTNGKDWKAVAPAQNSNDEDPRLFRVIRGGSWDSIASNCRSTSRRRQAQMVGSIKIGFRVVME